MGKLKDGFRRAAGKLAGNCIGIGSLGLGCGLAARELVELSRLSNRPLIFLLGRIYLACSTRPMVMISASLVPS